MRRKTLSLICLIAVCGIFLTACPMGDGGVSMEGQVSDENGKPIKGARVILISRGAKDERMVLMTWA